ncbi:MAG: alanine racemase [Lachnospiraceae bacterium]|nr:alanine racemase [Lachnospiraceae bacterium]
MATFDRICACVDLDAIRGNLRAMHALTKEGTGVIPVVKADAYGHGAVETALALEKEPYVIRFAVATAEEASELYEAGVRKPVMLLGGCFPDSVPRLIRIGAAMTVSSLEQAEMISREAVKQGREAEIFIAADTGMHRIGFRVSEEAASEAGRILELPYLKAGGTFSHFARADEEDLTAAKDQFEKMKQWIRLLEERGIRMPLRMISNSAGLLTMPEANMDAVRAGIMMYGLAPSDEMIPLMKEKGVVLKPAMRLVSHVVFLKMIAPGDSVSYGGLYTADSPRKVATIPVGYADGYPRGLSMKGSVLIRGKRAPILGRVCMDQFMVDVTDIPGVQAQDEVILLGENGEERITAEEIGRLSGRFNYEFVCGISPRVPRIYNKVSEGE